MIETIMHELNSLDNPKIGIVLCSKDWFYISENGSLPQRPSFDKELITRLAEDKIILCSPNTHKTLPKSIRNAALGITTNTSAPWEVNFGIDTFKEQCDAFILVRSRESLRNGKKFNFDRLCEQYSDGYTQTIFADEECEIFIFKKIACESKNNGSYTKDELINMTDERIEELLKETGINISVNSDMSLIQIKNKFINAILNHLENK